MNKKDEKTITALRNAYALFNRRWDDVEKVIDYDDSWKSMPTPQQQETRKKNRGLIHNYNGAFDDPAVKAMQPGDIAKSIDDHGVKLILVQTRFGPVIVYPITAQVGLISLVWHDLSPSLHAVVDDILIKGPAAMARMIGSSSDVFEKRSHRFFNIGERLEIHAKMYADPNFRPDRADVMGVIRPPGELY